MRSMLCPKRGVRVSQNTRKLKRIKKKRRIYYLTEKAKETENIGVKTLAYKLKEYNKLIT